MPNAEGNTPLHLAVMNDNPQCVKLLLIHGTDMHISELVRDGLVALALADLDWFVDYIV